MTAAAARPDHRSGKNTYGGSGSYPCTDAQLAQLVPGSVPRSCLPLFLCSCAPRHSACRACLIRTHYDTASAVMSMGGESPHGQVAEP